MKISFKTWLKEYALAYIFGLLVAFALLFFLSIAFSGFPGISSKITLMVLAGSMMFVGQGIQAVLSGQLSALPDTLLIIAFLLLPILLVFVTAGKKRKFFWVAWSLVWGVISISLMGLALPLVVPV